MSELPFFHEMPDSEWESMLSAAATWGDVQKKYRQPSWCDYPEALDGAMGCWSLVGRMVTGEDYCKNCDLYKPKEIS